MRTRSSKGELVPLNLEIERSCRDNRRKKMADDQQQRQIHELQAQLEALRRENEARQPPPNQDEVAMTDLLAPHRPRNRAGVVVPRIQANNFELKSSIIQMVQSFGQFTGGAHENPSDHLDRFLQVADTVKMNGVSEDIIRLKLFPFSLIGGADEWYKSLPAGSVTSWDELEERFLSYYFSPARTMQLKNDITS